MLAPTTTVLPPALRIDAARSREVLIKSRGYAFASAICKALISIEENDLKRMAVKAQPAMAERAFGIPMMVVASPAEADIAAKQKLDRV
ncbi:MAG: hypothetical protein AB1592_10160 [Pseudomonadota bacterium]